IPNEMLMQQVQCEFLVQEYGMPFFSELQDAMKKAGVDFTSHGVLPVHPWQFETLSLKGNPLFLYLGKIGPYYGATQSLRTLFPNCKSRSFLKVPLSVQLTSSVRTLEPIALCIAPHLSLWLEKIIETDRYLKNCNLRILKEFASIALRPEDTEGFGNQLGALWREQVDKNQHTLPFNALLIEEENGMTFLSQCLEKYECEEWVTQFVAVCVLPILHLALVHEIGVEAHAQNILLTFEDGWPSGAILRDFNESVECTTDTVANKALYMWIEENYPSYFELPVSKQYFVASKKEVIQLVIDCLFVYACNELAYIVHKTVGFPHHQFWQIIQKEIGKHFQMNGLEKEMLSSQLFGEKFNAESLFKNTLERHRKNEYVHTVKTPWKM
ncbi:MAG: IucA/IucC family protein, partial [Bacilli bacterium]